MNFGEAQELIDLVKTGAVKHVEKDNVIIYKCGNIVRIDIKQEA